MMDRILGCDSMLDSLWMTNLVRIKHVIPAKGTDISIGYLTYRYVYIRADDGVGKLEICSIR